MNIEGRTIRLRAVEPGDVDLMYEWENDCDIWPVSGTTEPFSRHQLERFVERHQDIVGVLCDGQLRLIIETLLSSKPVGRRHGRSGRSTCSNTTRSTAGQASASSSTNGATGAGATPPTHWKLSAAMHTTRCARISCGATSVPTTKRACACSAARDSPRSASNATGYGGPTAITTRGCCKRYSTETADREKERD